MNFFNPEELLDYKFISNDSEFDEMMHTLEGYKSVVIDCETVGNTAISMFLEQLEIEKKIDAMYSENPDFFEEGVFKMEETKRLCKEYETFIKDYYDIKAVRLLGLKPEHREMLKARRKEVKDCEEKYKEVKEYKRLKKLHDAIQSKIDKDESGLFFQQNRLGLVQIGTVGKLNDKTGWKQFLIDPNVLVNKNLEGFKEFLMTRSLVIGHNLKFDMIQLYRHLNIDFNKSENVCYDTMLAAKVVKSGILRRFGMKDLALEYLHYEQSKEERVTYWLRRPLKDDQQKYAALDVIIPGILFHILREEIRENKLEEAAKLQMDFLKVLTKMELTGIYVDLAKAEALSKEVDEKVEEKRYSLASQLGDTVWFNPEKGHNEIKINKDFNSPKETLNQLQKYGYKHNLVDLQYLGGTSKNAFEEIEADIPLLDEIKEFRSLLHTKETYCNAILTRHVDSRIHSSFVQLQAEGTRMSSTKPNVQNISRPGVWDKSKHATFEEAYVTWTPKKKLRTLFIPAPGRKLFDADYGAIELCMIAYYSQDVMMIKALNEGVDLHALTANRIFNLGYTYEELADKNILKDFKMKFGKERQIAKTFNFAVVYGAGPRKLLKQLMIDANIYDMSEEELRTLRNEWYALYPGVKTWQDNTLSVANNHGYGTTRLGRNIYFEDPARVYSKAFNTPIQASCYEGLQLSAIEFNDKVTKLEKEGVIRPNSIQLVNLVHDEFVVETDADVEDSFVVKLIEDAMKAGMQPLMDDAFDAKGEQTHERVPVAVDCSRINTWADK